ncbi:hypothetical protein BGZ93_007292 [Podila epicladia]|nr:hypothetical protein BGZ92_004643 [Podila epicladia]KAG0094385.1 hypothetical protein BGZ93_007292 [Podila epicladia]
MKDLTAAELALEALLESRLEILTARINKLHEDSHQLYTSTQALSSVFQAKFKRVYYVEDHLLRLQGKPGLSEQYLENGSQPSKGVNSKDLENFKMGVKTLRRKFQAAGAVASTVGWWRHLKDKSPSKVNLTVVPPAPTLIETHVKAAKETPPALIIETTLPVEPPSEALMSPNTKRKNTLALQQIFSSPPPSSAKPLHQHYITSPSSERANPALGLYSPPLSPKGTGPVNSLMRGLSLRS